MPEGVGRGLAGVVVADSAVCYIDGQRGVLRYRGIDIGELAKHSSYEETAYLLWFGELASQSQLDEFKARLAAERELDDSVRDMLASFPCWLEPMEALRTAVSALSSCGPHAGDGPSTGSGQAPSTGSGQAPSTGSGQAPSTGSGQRPRQANINKAIYLTARMPTIVACYHRYSTGQEQVPPDPNLSHAANFLYMLRGEPPAPVEERAMDLIMILSAEHEFNASTFAARVTASTLSDMYSAIISAIATLKGPLHGGASQRAMEMLLEIGDEENVERYMAEALAARKRIMGFGHRVYKTIDPRAVCLRDMAYALKAETENPHWCHLSLLVDEAVEAKKKGLYPNVDFFSAPLLYTLGVPLNLFTPVFAISRIVGWTAHVMEQYEDNCLIRPLSNYVGPAQRPYVPIAER